MTVKQLEARKQLEVKLREILFSMGCQEVSVVLVVNGKGCRIVQVNGDNSQELDDESEIHNFKRISTKLKQQSYMG